MSGKERDNPNIKIYTIKEIATLGSTKALFRLHKSPIDAVLEIIDNCVDNRVPGFLSQIAVAVRPDELVIVNRGGQGLGLEGLEKMFTWGYSEKDAASSIGQYGVGGKGAMGSLGRSVAIRCKAVGENVEYYWSDNDFVSKSGTTEQIHQVKGRETENLLGEFQVTIRNLSRKIPSTQGLRTRIGETYAPLITSKEVRIVVNREEVEPIRVVYDESDPQIQPINLELISGTGHRIHLTAGLKSEQQSHFPPGFRIFYNGRLMEIGEFFGHPTDRQDSQMARFIGEISTSHLVPDAHKTGFIKGTAEWEDAQSLIHQAVSPLIEGIKRMPKEDRTRIEKYEQHLVQKVKKVFEELLNDANLMSLEFFSAIRKYKLAEEESTEDNSTKLGQVGDTTMKRRGKKRSRVEENEEGRLRRRKAAFEMDVKPLGRDDIRATFIEENGIKKLIINADFPMYQAANDINNLRFLTYYELDTALHEILGVVNPDITPDEHKRLVTDFLRKIGKMFLGETIAARNKQ